MTRRRRDPHAERAGRVAGPAGRLRVPVPDTITTRRRRDPHLERLASGTGMAGRLRRDPHGRAVPSVIAESIQTAAVAPAIVIVEAPTRWVLAVPDLTGGRLDRTDDGFLAAARQLADQLDAALVVLAFTAVDPPALGRCGADRVIEAVAGDDPERRAAICRAAVEQIRPRHAVFPDTPLGGGDLGRRLAADLREEPATAVVRVARDEVTRRGAGVDFAGAPPRVLLLLEQAHAVRPTISREGRLIPLVTNESRGTVRDLGEAEVDLAAVPLGEALFIASAGDGVTDWTSFRAVSRALGAVEGGSRVACDAGHLPRDRQVGASGTLVAPQCYLALGISGAPQHLQGIVRAERVVAVNTDLHAQMIRRADLAIVADAQPVMAALTRLLDAEGGRG